MSNELEIYRVGYELANISYQLYEQSLDGSVELADQFGQIGSYQVHMLKENVRGLNAYVLIPERDHAELKIVFTGTQDIFGLIRSFEPLSAGGITFATVYEQLSNQLTHILTEHYAAHNSVHLTIAGHSLGGTDAEHFLAFLLQDKLNGKFDQINQLELYSFNSPGMTHAFAEQAKVDANQLLDQQSDFSISLHYGKSKYDKIQWLGESHLLVDYEEGKSSTDLLVVEKDETLAQDLLQKYAYPAISYLSEFYLHHALDWFNKDAVTFKGHQYYHVSCDHDEIMEHLHEKASWFLYLTYYPKNLLYNTLAWVYGSPLKIDNPIDNLIDRSDISLDINEIIFETNQYDSYLSIDSSCLTAVSMREPFADQLLPIYTDFEYF